MDNSKGKKENLQGQVKVTRSMSDYQLGKRENNKSSNEGNNTAEGNEIKMHDLINCNYCNNLLL